MISIKVNPKSELHRRICNSLRQRVKQSAKSHSVRTKKWREAEELFVGYMPEKENDRLRREKREGGVPDYTTIQLPYSYAVAMTAHSYWCSVFLSRSPVWQFMGNTGEGEMQVQAVEALINYQMFKARMAANMYIWLQDVPKYGEAWVSPYWRIDRSRVSEIVEVEAKYLGIIGTGKMVRKRIIRELIGYQGNALYNIHPAKVFTDPRYPRNRFQDGEFIAIETELSWNQLVKGAQTGQYINIQELRKSRPGQSWEGEGGKEDSDADLLTQPSPDEFTSSDVSNASDVFKVYEGVVEIIPRDWKLGKGDMPEKWVFTTTSDFKHLVECRPLGNIHDKFPLANLEMDPEGYATYSRSLLETFSGVQETLDWLVNSHFFNVRQALNNQWILDPSRVQERDLANGYPGKAIRLKPAAYGTDVSSALKQLPVADVTRSHLNDMQMMYQMGERLGMNDQVMGLSTPTSRRSATEVRGSQTFGVGRLKTIAEYFSATGFMDLGSMLVQNSQQFYDTEMKVKLAGDAANLAGEGFINITPEDIAGQYSFEPVDGSLPMDRFAQANLWREMIAQMSAVPQVAASYDLGKIFGYVAQLAGIKNLQRFKVDVVPDGQLLDQVQKGNVVPMAEKNILEPGQVSQVGPTA